MILDDGARRCLMPGGDLVELGVALGERVRRLRGVGHPGPSLGRPGERPA